MPARTTHADVAESAAYTLALLDTLMPKGGYRRVDLGRGELGEAFQMLRQDCEDAGLFEQFERQPDGRYVIPDIHAPEVIHAFDR